MILRSVHLVNFKKYKKASITLDNSLIGIFGNNGAGKSSLLEAVTWGLYGVAQSMEGKEGVKQKDLIRDGEEEMGVEVEFSLGSHMYKVTRYLNAKRGIKSRLWIDGKLQARKSTEVVARVERDIGLNVKGFISSSFIRQKEMDLITSKIASERKKLINRLFNLRIYEKFEEIAKNRKKEKENELQAVHMVMKEKEKDIGELPELEEELKQLGKTVETLKQEYDGIKQESESVKKEYSLLEKEYQHYQELQYRLKVLERDVENTGQTLEERKKDFKEIEKAEVRKRELQPQYDEFLKVKESFSRLDSLKSEYDKKVKEKENLETEISVTQKNLEERITECSQEIADLETQEEKLEETRALLESVKEKISALSDIPQKKEEEVGKLDKMKEKEAELLAEKKACQGKIADLTRELEDVESLGVGAPCPKCKRPLEKAHMEQLITRYRAEISVHEKVLEKYVTRERHLHEMRKELENRIRELKKEEDTLTALKKEEQKYVKAEVNLENIRKRKKEVQAKILENRKKLSNLEEGKIKIQKLREEIDQLPFDPITYETTKKKIEETSAVEREIIKLNERISRKDDINSYIAEAETLLGKRIGEAGEIKANIEGMVTVPEKFSAAKDKKDHIMGKELEVSRQYTEKKTVYQEREKEIQRLHRVKEELKDLKKNQKDLENMIVTYAVLQEAFRQIPVQIQSRLRPRIRNEASSLLREITEGKYPYIDLGKDYSVTVYYDGQYYPISRFSGGEKDLINLCLRVGISQVLVSLSSLTSFARIQSLFLDECFGSFDIERRRNLLAAIAELRNHFAQIVVITHIDEIKEALPEAFLVEELPDGSSLVRKVK
ncbi:MAG: SMC family ATPase [Candidatus Methanofastidiosia archaeon]